MAGAAAQSILLAIAITKVGGDEAKELKQYATAGWRGRVTKSVASGLKGSIGHRFEAALYVLHYGVTMLRTAWQQR
jgi:hypothetical protein